MSSSRAQTLLRYVGANVRRLREACDWTQKDLADKAAMSWRSVQDLERGSGNPTLKLLIAVAHALRVDPSDLFAATKVEKREPGRPPEN